jgi:hypothetical protein
MFGGIFALTGSARLAVLSLLVQFVLGWLLVVRLSVAQGQREALAPVGNGSDSP